MNDRVPRVIGILALGLLLSAIIGSGFSQSSSNTATVSVRPVSPPHGGDDALLKEVRAIREILQQAGGATQREQMIVERIRTHDERVEWLDRQLSELRDEIGGIEVHLRQTDEREKALESQIPRATDPAQRQAREAEQKEMRFMAEAQRQRLDRLREREATMAEHMEREEQTLRSLEVRLEALDRELEAEARSSIGFNRGGGR